MKEFIIGLHDDEVFYVIAKSYTLHELVRCKDCKHGEPACGNINCKKDGLFAVDIHPVNWFCADGVHKEGR